MDIIMQMNYAEFSNALRNGCLPEISTQQKIIYKNNLFVPMIRDVNDDYTTYSEWLYGRRENLRRFTEKDLFQISPFSKENYAWVDEKLEQMCLHLCDGFEMVEGLEEEDEEGEVIEWANEEVSDFNFNFNFNFNIYSIPDFYNDNNDNEESDFDYYDRSLYCDSDDYWFR
jgi:hypothetical protein